MTNPDYYGQVFKFQESKHTQFVWSRNDQWSLIRAAILNDSESWIKK